jgi:transcriptional regulator with XRE-family HTH domain
MDVRDLKLKYVEIGNRIRNEREARELSQDKLAEMVDLGADHIRNIEYGERGMSVIALVRIAGALDLSIDYVIHGTVAVHVEEDMEPEKKEKIESTVRIMERMDTRECSRVEAIVRMIRDTMKKTE